MNVVAVPIIESNTELQGTRHSSMTARNVGGTTDRNSLSTRQANGAAMLVEVHAEKHHLKRIALLPACDTVDNVHGFHKKRCHRDFTIAFLFTKAFWRTEHVPLA